MVEGAVVLERIENSGLAKNHRPPPAGRLLTKAASRREKLFDQTAPDVVGENGSWNRQVC
jgi:hypothetical protein